MVKKIYNRNKNVYEAAIERIEYIFDNFDNIVVSCSGGKDSTITTYLTNEIAKKKGRKFYLFYLDQEIEYSSTIKFMDTLMKLPNVIPLWFQVPCLLTNTSSISQNEIDPWNPKKKDVWIRGQKMKAIKEINWDVSDVKFQFPDKKMYGFYGLVECLESLFKNSGSTAQIIGLRADESLDRYRAVTKNPAIDNIKWSTKGNNHIKFYPIYDWTFRDIWVYLSRNNLEYNKMYDYFWLKGYSPNKMRLSNLLHEKAYECIADLQEFEPKLFDRMIDRCQGVSTAQEYAGRGGGIYKAVKLPKHFKTWVEYRDYLLNTLPNQDHADIFKKRFSKQYNNDYVIKQQVNRILIYDIHNFKKINNFEHDPAQKVREKWMEIL